MEDGNIVWLVYDGECPICKPAANALKIKKAAGDLRLINKRTDKHPILDEIRQHGMSVKDGLVIKMNGNYYQGADALHITALIGTGSDLMNRVNVMLFRSKNFTKLVYPILRGIRQIGLRCKGVRDIVD